MDEFVRLFQHITGGVWITAIFIVWAVIMHELSAKLGEARWVAAAIYTIASAPIAFTILLIVMKIFW